MEAVHIQVHDQQGHLTLYVNGREVLSWDSYMPVPWEAVWWKPWTWKRAKAWLESSRELAFWCKPPEQIFNVTVDLKERT